MDCVCVCCYDEVCVFLYPSLFLLFSFSLVFDWVFHLNFCWMCHRLPPKMCSVHVCVHFTHFRLLFTFSRMLLRLLWLPIIFHCFSFSFCIFSCFCSYCDNPMAWKLTHKTYSLSPYLTAIYLALNRQKFCVGFNFIVAK